MTTEAVLILGLFVFILLGIFLGDSGPRAVFARSGPRLGARIETHITIGNRFLQNGAENKWETPPVGSPGSEFE